MALFFAVVFVISAVLSVLLINVEMILFQPQIYKNALQNQEVYENLPGVIARQIAHSMRFNPCLEDPTQCEGEDLSFSDEGSPSYLMILSEDAWTRILSPLLSPHWLQSETESIIDQFFTAVEDGDGTIDIIISMDGFKNSFNEQNTSGIAATLLEDAPACTDEELASIAALVINQQAGELPICLPAEEMKPFLEDELQRSVLALADKLQSEFVLKLDLTGDNAEIEIPPFNNLIGNHPLQWLQTLREFFLISAIIPILALLMIALFTIRSWYSFLQWMGFPILLSGGILLLPAISAGLMYQWLADTFLLPNIPSGFTLGLVNIFVSSIHNVITRFSFWIGLEAGLLILLGSGMLFLSLFFRPHKQPAL